MKTKDIKQQIILPCSPQEAFDAWLDSKTHAAMIGASAKIDPKVGGKFDIWDNYLIGKTTQIDRKKLIIAQDWRDNSTDWPEDYYSKITVEFHPVGADQTKIVFTQTGIPQEHAKSIEEGWEDYYWKPMKKYFGK